MIRAYGSATFCENLWDYVVKIIIKIKYEFFSQLPLDFCLLVLQKHTADGRKRSKYKTHADINKTLELVFSIWIMLECNFGKQFKYCKIGVGFLYLFSPSLLRRRHFIDISNDYWKRNVIDLCRPGL